MMRTVQVEGMTHTDYERTGVHHAYNSWTSPSIGSLPVRGAPGEAREQCGAASAAGEDAGGDFDAHHQIGGAPAIAHLKLLVAVPVRVLAVLRLDGHQLPPRDLR
jgi:hypothetical protein